MSLHRWGRRGLERVVGMFTIVHWAAIEKVKFFGSLSENRTSEYDERLAAGISSADRYYTRRCAGCPSGFPRIASRSLPL